MNSISINPTTQMHGKVPVSPRDSTGSYQASPPSPAVSPSTAKWRPSRLRNPTPSPSPSSDSSSGYAHRRFYGVSTRVSADPLQRVPQKINCEFSSNHLFYYAQYLWSTHDFLKLTRLFNSLVALKKSIIRVPAKYTNYTYVDPIVFAEINGIEEFLTSKGITPPDYPFNIAPTETVNVELQTPRHLEPRTWIYFFLAFAPRVSGLFDNLITEENVEKIKELLEHNFTEIVTTINSIQPFENYKKQLEYDIKHKIKDKYTRVQKSQAFRKTGLETYKDDKTINISNMSASIRTILKEMTMKDLAKNDEYARTIFMTLAVNQEIYTIPKEFLNEKGDLKEIRELRNIFYTKYPDFTQENCTEAQWNEWRPIFMYCFSFNNSAIEAVTGNYINHMKKLIDNFVFMSYWKPEGSPGFSKHNAPRFNTLDLKFINHQEIIDRAIGKVSALHYHEFENEVWQYGDREISIKTIMNALFDTNKLLSTETIQCILRFLRKLEMTKEEMNAYAPISYVFYYYGGIVTKARFCHCLSTVETVVETYKQRNLDMEKYRHIEASMIKNAKKYSHDVKTELEQAKMHLCELNKQLKETSEPNEKLEQDITIQSNKVDKLSSNLVILKSIIEKDY